MESKTHPEMAKDMFVLQIFDYVDLLYMFFYRTGGPYIYVCFCCLIMVLYRDLFLLTSSTQNLLIMFIWTEPRQEALEKKQGGVVRLVFGG